MIRCELPEETLLEMGQWYQDIGANEEATEILQMAPSNAMVNVKLAYLNHLMGNQSTSQSLLSSVADMPIDVGFPFRAEQTTELNWAMEQSPNWKFKYYKALLKMHLGFEEEAKALIKQCGDEPEDGIFYLYRAKFIHRIRELYPGK